VIHYTIFLTIQQPIVQPVPEQRLCNSGISQILQNLQISRRPPNSRKKIELMERVQLMAEVSCPLANPHLYTELDIYGV